MRPNVKVASYVKHETYVDLLLDQIPQALGFEVKFLKLGDPPAAWTNGKGARYSPPEISVTHEMMYPFDTEQNAQEITDWMMKVLSALNQSIRMIISSGDSHVTFRPVHVQYDQNGVKLSTRVSVCIF
jgi:hypothetical protein